MIVVLKLFYITYKACEIKSAGWKSMQLSSAQGLLTVFITMHVIQLFLLIYKLTGNSVQNMEGGFLFLIAGIYLVATRGINYFFNRIILAKAIARNNDSIGLTSARLITFSYLIVNICLTSILFTLKK